MISPAYNTIHIFYYSLSRCFIGMVLERFTRIGWAKLIAVKKRFQCYLSSEDYVIKAVHFRFVFPMQQRHALSHYNHSLSKYWNTSFSRKWIEMAQNLWWMTQDIVQLTLTAQRLDYMHADCNFQHMYQDVYQRPFWSDNSHGWIAYTTVGKHHFFASLSIALD